MEFLRVKSVGISVIEELGVVCNIFFGKAWKAKKAKGYDDVTEAEKLFGEAPERHLVTILVVC